MNKRQRHLHAATGGPICAALLGGALAEPAHAQCPPRFEVTAILQGPECPFGTTGGITPTGLNDNGWIVGGVNCGFNAQPFIWRGEGAWENIPFPPGVTGTGGASDINNNGQVIVGFNNDPVLGNGDFIYDGVSSTLLPFPPPPAVATEGIAINQGGMVVGNWRGNKLREAVLWDEGEVVQINQFLGTPESEAWGVNDKGWITGWMGTATTTDARAFILDGEKAVDLGVIPGGYTSVGYGVNELGQVAGQGRVHNPNGGADGRAFFWDGSTMHNLGVLEPYRHSGASELNDWAWVVGGCAGALGLDTAFLWIDGQMWNLNDLVQSPRGTYLDGARAINNKGQVLCNGRIPGNNTVAILLTPIQRPDTDLNDDCVTNVLDLIALLGLWGDTGGFDNPADFNNDETVNVLDLLILLGHWGS